MHNGEALYYNHKTSAFSNFKRTDFTWAVYQYRYLGWKSEDWNKDRASADWIILV